MNRNRSLPRASGLLIGGGLVRLFLAAATALAADVRKKPVEIGLRPINSGAADKVSFTRDIRPILLHACVECYSAQDRQSDFEVLERTLVCLRTELGRTIASAPSAGTETEGFAERHTGEELVIANEKMYGFHGHFSSCNCMTFFGGGFKRGYVHGKTAERHPMLAVEDPVPLIDVHATIYRALGIPANTSYLSEGRPFYVTKDGKGTVIEPLLA